MIKLLMAALVTAIQRPTLTDAEADDLTCTVATDKGDIYVLEDTHGYYQVKTNNPYDSIIFSFCTPLVSNETTYVLKTSNSKPADFPVFDGSLQASKENNVQIKRYSSSDCASDPSRKVSFTVEIKCDY
jgi:hypothetical protein